MKKKKSENKIFDPLLAIAYTKHKEILALKATGKEIKEKSVDKRKKKW